MVMRVGAWMVAVGARLQASYGTVMSDRLRGVSVEVSAKGEPC
jgi:hypothetical protein